MATTKSDAFDELLDRIPEIGRRWHGAVPLANARANLSRVSKSFRDLPRPSGAKGESAVLISAGPSVARRNSIARVRDSGYSGTIVAADGSLVACLRAGLVPDYVITLDPHPRRVVRWFGDPDMEANREGDDYFERQDLDVNFRKDAARINLENLELINRHAPRIRAVVATCSSESVTRRIGQAGFDTYWWNPLIDDPRAPESMTRQLHELNRLPCMNTGGTVGTAAWVFLDSILKVPRIGMVGVDLGYYADLPLKMTQTYYELAAYHGSEVGIEKYFPEAVFPLTGERFYTDPTYAWYRRNFIDLLARGKAATYNCSEGGTLFGPGISCVKLEEFLAGRS